MAVPKRKTSKSSRNKRRTHKKITSILVGQCSVCGEPKLSHRVCLECGSYRGKVVIDVEK